MNQSFQIVFGVQKYYAMAGAPGSNPEAAKIQTDTPKTAADYQKEINKIDAEIAKIQAEEAKWAETQNGDNENQIDYAQLIQNQYVQRAELSRQMRSLTNTIAADNAQSAKVANEHASTQFGTTSEGKRLLDNRTNGINDAVQKTEAQKDTVKETTQAKVGAPENPAPDSLRGTVEAKEVHIDQFRHWQALAEKGDENAQKELVMAIFSDFDNMYMPDIPFLRGLGFNGAVIEKENKVRLFGANSNKQPISELQFYRIIKNNEQLAGKFLVKNIPNWQNATLADIKTAQTKLFEKVNQLAEVQTMITGKQTNASVDIPTVLAGNEKAYIENLLKKQDTIKNIQDKPEAERAKVVENLLAMGISFILPPVAVGYESQTLGLKDIEAMKANPASLVYGGAQNITGKLTLLVPTLTVQWNVNDRTTEVLQTAHKYGESLKAIPEAQVTMETLKKVDPSLENNQAVKTYLENKDKIPYQNLVDTLTYNKMISLGQEKAGWGFKGVQASLGVLGASAGIVMQNVDIDYRGTDGKVRRKVVEGIEQKAKLATIEQKGDKNVYTLRNIDGLEAKIKSIDPSATFEKNGNNLVATTAKRLSVAGHLEVNNDGSETIDYKITENTSSDTVAQNTDIKETLMTRELAGKEVANRIYTLNRRDKGFDAILAQISDGYTDEAFAALTTNRKYEDIAKLVTTDGKMDPAKMQELLTYTYGAKNVKNAAGNIDKSAYDASRSKVVLDAETKVIANAIGVSGVAPNEAEFTGVDMHRAKSAADIYPGQALAMGVVATPRGGTHRFDKFDSALQISQQTVLVDNVDMKKALLKQFDSRMQSELARINKALGLNISKEDYAAMVLGEKKPEEVNPKLKFQDGKKPQIFEARAMLNGNICNNLTYGIAFPGFTLDGKGTANVIEGTIGAGSLMATYVNTEAYVGGKLNLKGGDKEQPKQREEHNAPTKPTPGREPLTPTPTPTPTTPNAANHVTQVTAGPATTNVPLNNAAQMVTGSTPVVPIAANNVTPVNVNTSSVSLE